MVGTPELSASGGETTTGNGGGGHSGPETESRVHLESQLEKLSVELTEATYLGITSKKARQTGVGEQATSSTERRRSEAALRK